MKTFLDYFLGGLFAAVMGLGLALIYIYRTGGF
jgi:hypothetical protein